VSLPDLAEARANYANLGFDTVPLHPNSKDAIDTRWPEREPADMWAKAPADANVGIRGAGLALAAFMDADEYKRPGTLANVQNWLWGLGFEPGGYPVVASASGRGRHIYLSLIGELPGDARHLAADIGAGEFRYGRGALVVACPSVVGERRYQLLEGDYRQPARVTVADVLPLLQNKSLEAVAPKPRVSSSAWGLLQGRDIDRYGSRSEAEQAIVTMLVNSGHDFAAVVRLFQSNPAAGKFRELDARGGNAGLRWLRMSYANAQTWASASESEGRKLARAALAWGQTRAWPGRTGSIDRAVFLAHAQIALRAGRLNYGAACRELGELAGVTFRTASAATVRLMRAAFLALHDASTPSRPNVYRLNVPNVGTFAIPASVPNLHTPSLPHVRECVSYATHDLFRPGGLGKAAGEVWTALQDGPASAPRLAELTGRRPRTVRGALRRMARIVDPVTGEILPALALVAAEGKQWRAVDGVDLDRVALVLGTAGKGKRQREQHRQERRAHQRALLRGAGVSEPQAARTAPKGRDCAGATD
jgi:Bifunctional DNA primase/polymerase, N-terminal